MPVHGNSVDELLQQQEQQDRQVIETGSSQLQMSAEQQQFMLQNAELTKLYLGSNENRDDKDR